MNRRVVALLALGLFAVAVWTVIRVRHGKHPVPLTELGSEAPPPSVVEPFYVGISSLDVEENERAARLFEELSQKLSREPAIWANLGLARLRLGDLPGAEEALEEAAKRAPQNRQIAVLQAIVAEHQGQFSRAIERLRQIPDPDPAVLYQLSELLSRTGRDTDPTEQLAILDRIRAREPGNLVVAFNRARLLARAENAALLSEAVQAFDSSRASWGSAAVQEFDAAKNAIASRNFRAAATHLAFLQNLNLSSPAYQAGLSELGMTGGSVGHPIREFLTYRAPEVLVPPADLALHFVQAPDAISSSPDLYLAATLSEKSGASLVSLTGETLRLRPGVELAAPGTNSAFCAADLNGDFLPDVALINGNGLKLWIQDKDGHFNPFHPADDVRAAFEKAGHGVWAIDFDADGDLDLLVARDGGAPQILRNNGDGSFTALDVLSSFPEVRDVCWGDFGGDGDGDLAVLDVKGRVLVSWNERTGTFAVPELVSESPAVALTYGDVFGTGEMDLIVLEQNGAIENFHFDRATRKWSGRELARWSDSPDLVKAFNQHRASIILADLDNNGAVDLVVSAKTSSAIWLNQGQGKFQRLAQAPSLFVTSIADLNGDGFLDLIGLTETGVATAQTQGTKGYHWQSIQTRTLATHADSRINSFGIGGRIEVRAGPLLASAPITSPSTHFGLGDHDEVGVARIVWPNGVAQVEFSPPPDREVTAIQRLKGSCPWVFTRDGATFHFVKDFLWRSPLGMRINSQDTAGVDQTEDRILLPGQLLKADHGAYEIRITAELWETHFFDHVALEVVDHPSPVSVFVDERFVPTQPPKLDVVATSPLQPFRWARDQSGRDVSKALNAIDGDYVSDFPLGQFQGIAEEHWVEFQLPEDAPVDRPLVLVGEGWIYPTDSSLNVAISQGNHPAPHGLVLEEYDPQAGWRTASGDLGFPAGKNKTVVIPLPRPLLRAGQRHFRLRTNLEVYWDRLGWATALPEAELKTSRTQTLAADLRYRGFSNLGAAVRRKPDLPTYESLSGSVARWRDLEGYYTRYGDVRELLRDVDDRYVIMNAGDEIVLKFSVPPAPPAGWTRDFVLIGDGWVKDGDFNTANSRTVGPLPSHALHQYGGPSRPLDQDPVFQSHLEDWQIFHTRYVTPSTFAQGLMNGSSSHLDGGSP